MCLGTSSFFSECNFSTISLASFCDLISSFNSCSSNFKCLFFKIFLPMILHNSRLVFFRALKSNTSYSYKLCSLELLTIAKPYLFEKVSFKDAQKSLKAKISTFLTSKMDSSFLLTLVLLKTLKVSKENPREVGFLP